MHLSSQKNQKIEQSIFHPERNVELQSLFINSVPVIFGWCVNEALISLAELAVETLNIEEPLGLLKKGTKYSYYHPLLRVSFYFLVSFTGYFFNSSRILLRTSRSPLP